MYHVVTICAISVILYLLSLLGSRIGIINPRDHRSAWNMLLLFTFLFTAVAGILLALQATYKWDNPALRQILKWHVEAGTGMTFVALFHLSWHIRYYVNLLKTGSSASDDQAALFHGEISSGKRGIANLFILGLYTGIIQLIFLREIMNLSGGYELITGIIFFCWLLLSALGAYITGRSKKPLNSKMIYFLPLSGLVSVILMIAASRLLLSTGEYPTFITSIIISVIALLPACYISGALFILLTHGQYSSGGREPGSSFGIETGGGIIAGLFVAITGGSFLGNYQMLLLSSFVITALLLSINEKNREKGVKAGIIALSILAITIIIFSPDRAIRSMFLRGSTVETSLDSRYGNISVTDYQGEKNILYNHRLYSYPGDRILSEENIHYAMLQHPEPYSVLLISGGLTMHYEELKKYSTVKEVTYIEKDPRIIDQERMLNSFPSDSNLRIVTRDAYSYLRKTSDIYDVVIMLIPFPANLEANRYFTVEFYRLVKRHLSPGGMFMATAGAGSNYPGESAGKSLAITGKSIRNVFEFMIPVKGNRIYLIASDDSLTLDYPRMAEDKHINNDYVNAYYLDSTIIAFNSEQLTRLMSSYGENINSIAMPSLVYYNQEHELSKESGNSLFTLILLTVMVSLPLFFGKWKSRRIYSASFNLAGTEIISLIIIQSTVGSMYQFTGLIVSTLMAGLAAGASMRLSWLRLPQGLFPILIVAATLLTSLATGKLLGMNNSLVIFPAVMLIVFIPAFLTGRLFRISASSYTAIRSLSGLYGSDLFGAAAGFLVVSSFMIPVAGLQNSLLMLAFFNFAVYLTTLWKGAKSDG